MGDVLAIDQDAAAGQVVKAQQQVDQRRFAGAGAADQADLFTGRHGQRQLIDHAATTLGRVAPVAEGGLFEAYFATRHVERFCIGRVEHGALARHRLHAVLHRADVLEQAGHFPHDPVRHALQAQRHRRGRSHCADTHLPLRPEPQRHPCHAGRQPHAERVIDDLEGADEPHLAVAGVHEFLHGGACETGLALRMGKQLDGGDVGICIGHAAGHQRARIGLRLADLTESRHEKPQAADVEQQPEHERQHQPRIEHGGQHDHCGDVHAHRDQHIRQHEDGVAYRQRGLHHLGRDAAGKFILVERHALAQHQAVEIPAQSHRQVHRQCLVLDDGLQRDDADAQQQRDTEPDQRIAALRP